MKNIISVVILQAMLFASTAYSGSVNFTNDFPFKYAVGNVTVYSDISEEFSKIHGEHCLKVWRLYSKMFARTPGKSIELFYTKNQKRYDEVLKRYPTIVLKGARQVTVNWTGDHSQWFIVPYTEPDFGTQLHEISHYFMYFTYPKVYEYPWFCEGSAMYFESGYIDRADNLVVEKPFESLHGMFIDWRSKNGLVPLKKLVYMPQKEFYSGEFYKHYSQSMMLYYYLMRNHAGVMDRLMAEINRGKISQNGQIVDFIIKNTGRDLPQIEKEYVK
ncbi:MAG: hypothetical protein JXA20_07005 [Spirochaetes bacterium]|nr:hypothetical protein [Spirochaetota bacterium]